MRKILILSVLFLITLSLYAAEVTHIDNAELKELMDQDIPVVDVRTTSEWKKTGVIEDSHLIMFYDESGKYDMEEWLNQVARVATKDKPVVLICHSGGRSQQLAKYLTEVGGYTSVYNHKYGIAHWIKQNNPTVLPK